MINPSQKDYGNNKENASERVVGGEGVSYV